MRRPYKPRRHPEFDGETYKALFDRKRLMTCQKAVQEIMSDGKWTTLAVLRRDLLDLYSIMASEAGISARIRDLRKPKCGRMIVESKRLAKGLWQYRMLPPLPEEQLKMGLQK